LREVPGVLSQGKTLEELEENIRDAFEMMMEDTETPPTEVMTKELAVQV
jgi:predicted RNase H-like HicB family nuclease